MILALTSLPLSTDISPRLNVKEDTVKRHLASAKMSPQNYHTPDESWILWYSKKKVFNPSKKVYDIAHLATAREYWKIKGKIHAEAIDSIHCEAIGSSLWSLPRPRQHFISKLTSGFLGVSKWMQQWNQWENDICTLCGLPKDSSHLIYCKGSGAYDVWLLSLKSLQEWMDSVQTDPDISYTIINGSKNWRDGSTLPMSNLSLLQSNNRKIFLMTGNIYRVALFWMGIITTRLLQTNRVSQIWAKVAHCTHQENMANCLRYVGHWNGVLQDSENIQRASQEASINEHISKLYSATLHSLPHTDDTDTCYPSQRVNCYKKHLLWRLQYYGKKISTVKRPRLCCEWNNSYPGGWIILHIGKFYKSQGSDLSSHTVSQIV